MKSFFFAIVLALACQSAGHADDAAPALKAKLKPLIEGHCLECHGAEVQSAGLRLDTLSTDLGDTKALDTWVRVFDRVKAGEMPPPKSERPAKELLASATSTLKENLHAASLQRQRKEGRVVLRRLNGTEYENSVRELLGVRVPLKELLPEDTGAAGFDNVAAALELSSTHLLLYQEAAERAIAATIPAHPTITFKDHRTAKDMADKGSNFRQTLDRSCKLDGDALILYSKLPRYGLCSSNQVKSDGRYRVRMSLAAVGQDVASIPAAMMVVDTGREEPRLVEFRDVPAGKPTIVEMEVDLKRRQAFVVNLLTHWDIRAFKKPIAEYTGPGLRLEWIDIEGPIDPFPPVSYKTLFADVPLKARSVAMAEFEGKRVPKIDEKRSEQNWQNDPLMPVSADPKKDAERLIRDFLPRAFRRPVDEPTQAFFVSRVQAKLDAKYTFLDAMTYGYKSILSSPQFLLLQEGSAQGNRLDEYALASRLSYFLWSSPPDRELLELAAKGELAKPATLDAQVERLLKSPNSSRFTENFTGQWLDLRKMDATIPDPQLYGDFDGLLLWSMPQETHRFFEEVLQNDRSLVEFVDSDWTYLNERLAKLYGIPGVQGNGFRKVALPPGCHRGGVMTQASVLKVTADGTRTSPVLRGKWILERILGKPPAPPPPDVPAIEPDIRGATTIRQQLDKHRDMASCAMCHKHIDPPGFALENYDPIGGWRDFYRVGVRTKAGTVNLPDYTGRPIFRGPDVEKGGATPEGKAFKDIDDYRKILLEDKDQLARSLVQKVMVYATGADIQFADREVVEEIVAKLKTKNYGFRTLIHEVVQSRVFLNK